MKKNRLLKVCYVRTTSTALLKCFVLPTAAIYSKTRQTREAVRAIQQSISLDVYAATWQHKLSTVAGLLNI